MVYQHNGKKLIGALRTHSAILDRFSDLHQDSDDLRLRKLHSVMQSSLPTVQRNLRLIR